MGRGLGSDDLPAIQRLRVPCLLNAAACLLKLDGKAQGAGQAGGEAAGEAAGQGAGEARGEAVGGETRPALTALSRCAEVLRAGPCAASRAKALFRQAQAHAALHNWREAWQALSRPLTHPSHTPHTPRTHPSHTPHTHLTSPHIPSHTCTCTCGGRRCG